MFSLASRSFTHSSSRHLSLSHPHPASRVCLEIIKSHRRRLLRFVMTLCQQGVSYSSLSSHSYTFPMFHNRQTHHGSSTRLERYSFAERKHRQTFSVEKFSIWLTLEASRKKTKKQSQTAYRTFRLSVTLLSQNTIFFHLFNLQKYIHENNIKTARKRRRKRFVHSARLGLYTNKKWFFAALLFSALQLPSWKLFIPFRARERDILSPPPLVSALLRHFLSRGLSAIDLNARIN